MIGVCIIGVSGFGAVHYRDLMREVASGRANAVAAAIINQDEEEEKCRRLREVGCRIFDDYKAMLRDCRGKAELCLIPTGIYLHAPMTIDALRAGMNVYVEKPAAATIQEVREMRTVARRMGRFVAIGFQRMWSDVAWAMKEAILSGKLGEIRSIKGYRMSLRSRAYYSRNCWSGRLRIDDGWVLDSPLNNAFAHELSMICFLAGRSMERACNPSSVRAELYRANDIESPDIACMKIKTAEGPTLYFYAGHCCGAQESAALEIAGDKGVMTLTERGTEARICYDDGRIEIVGSVESEAQLREKIFTSLLARLDDPQTFICDLAIAQVHTLCVNGAHESSAIRPIGREFVSEVEWKDSTALVLDGAEEIIRDSYEHEELFAQRHVPWACTTREFSLDGYEAFIAPRQVER
ncbi:MAG: Gfo/Idh/MocA family oxidoreductase [Planctomycetes bacterium]|nr:Gfo/Idh/MocA family oxidoreductase [Planctomycetota bacterium]